MALKIRLARGGAKKRPFYRIVVAEASAPRDGRYVERVGTYNPMVPKDHDQRLVLKNERITYWLGQGAQPTERVQKMLASAGLPRHRLSANSQRSQHLAKSGLNARPLLLKLLPRLKPLPQKHLLMRHRLKKLPLMRLLLTKHLLKKLSLTRHRLTRRRLKKLPLMRHLLKRHRPKKQATTARTDVGVAPVDRGGGQRTWRQGPVQGKALHRRAA